MSIGSIFNMARTAMNAQQTAVQIASQNISNAETDGYSRQRVDLAASTPTVFPWGSIGTGVTIAGVSRARDALLDATFRGDSASASSAQTTSDALSQIQGIFGEPSDNGLGASLDAFWSAWGDLANDPTNSAAKSVVRQTGSTVASTLNRFARQLDSLDQSNREGMNADVTQINALTSQIATMNREIVGVEATGNSANDGDSRMPRAVRSGSPPAGGGIVTSKKLPAALATGGFPVKT
jgi:flagellar hook-associated protein 1 FlgK